MEYAKRMFADGRLSEPLILDALTAGDQEVVVCALALRAEVSVERVQKIIATQSAKGMVALSWQAGFDMPAAMVLQTKLAKVPPPDLVRSRAGSQGFPMTPEEMSWQLEFFASMVGDVKPEA
jgi:hypothetical protein